jgi:dTDP-4-dehydrorhamnose reductase
MKILLTGANGQLGRVLPPALLGHEVVGLSRAQLDITKLNLVRDAFDWHRPDVVINAAAYTNVDAAETDQENAYRLNALGPRNLAQVTGEADVPLVHVSTDYVFDGAGKRPLHEYDPVNPQSVYGQSKLAGEQQVALFNPRHYIARTAWLYAAPVKGEGRNFPLTMLAQATKPDVEFVRVVNDQFGSPTFAPHLALALAQLILTDAYGVYHLAGQGHASWFELTTELYYRSTITLPVYPVKSEEYPRPAKRPKYSVLTTIQDPPILLPPWEEGLAEFVWLVRRNR